MVEGGSEKAFAQWLAERPQSFCEKVEAVAMDAFAGYKKAAARQVPHAVEILDPYLRSAFGLGEQSSISAYFATVPRST